jgi:hypothetical protein
MLIQKVGIGAGGMGGGYMWHFEKFEKLAKTPNIASLTAVLLRKA